MNEHIGRSDECASVEDLRSADGSHCEEYSPPAVTRLGDLRSLTQAGFVTPSADGGTFAS